MTTIAYKDGIVAADTGVSYSGTRVGSTTKIVKTRRGDVAAATGETAICQDFLNWVLRGERGNRPDFGDKGRGAIFMADGSIRVFEGSSEFMMSAPFYALGSGSSEAMGAMQFGAAAEEAVRVAMALDVYTFGGVEVLTVGRGAKSRPKRRRAHAGA